MSFPVGTEIRKALEELGPTFVKLGQIMSTRLDLLPPEVTSELRKLQDAVPPVPYEQVKPVIEMELGDSVERAFKEFHETPIAAASIAQVYRATLLSGKSVIVKVQRPGIDQIVDLDLAILRDLAALIDKRMPKARLYRLPNMAEEFAATMRDELDFRLEAENIDRFRGTLARTGGIRVPEVSWTHTAKRVITMEHVDGVRASDIQGLRAAAVDLRSVAKRLADSIIQQMLRDGIFHADPHPGNILIAPGDTIVLLDFGMVGRLSDKKKRLLLRMVLGIAFDEPRIIVEAITGLGSLPEPINLHRLESDIEQVRNTYIYLPMEEIKIGAILTSIFGLVSSYGIFIPSEVAMLSRALVTLEGTVAMLDPELNLVDVAVPIAKRLMVGTISPSELAKGAMVGLSEYATLARTLPSAVLNLIRTLEASDYTLKFQLTGTKSIEKRIERAVNRMSVSVMLLALSIVVTGLILAASLANETGATSYLFSGAILKVCLVLGVATILVLVLSVIRSNFL